MASKDTAMIRTILCICIGVVFLLVTSVAAKEAKPSSSSAGPYCGIYCVYAALRAVGISTDFAQLTASEYVGSHQGSSAIELQAAIRNAGGDAKIVSGMSAASLRFSTQPIILHISRPGYQTTYAHWILYLGVEKGKARILDPPNEVELAEFADLLALWDGTGVIVAKAEPDTRSLQIGSLILYFSSVLVCAILLIGLTTVLNLCRSFRNFRNWHSLPFGLLIFVIGLTCLLGQLLLLPEGMLRNWGSTSLVVGRFFLSNLQQIDFDTAKSYMESQSAIIIDARRMMAFQEGHLPGAIHLPIDSGFVERRRVFESIPQNRPVIFYCQSSGCGWLVVSLP
jgi:hypothetical protein